MATPSNPPQAPRNYQFPAWSIAKILLGLILVAFVVSKTSVLELSLQIAHVSWIWVICALCLFCLMSFLKAWQYHVLLGRDVPYKQVLGIVVLQNAISNFVATSAGIVAYLSVLRAEQSVRISRSATVFLLAKVGDVISIWVSLIISLFFVWAQVESVHVLILSVVAIIGLSLLAFLAVILLRGRFIEWLRRWLSRIGAMDLRLIRRSFDFIDALNEHDQSSIFHVLFTASRLSFFYLVVGIFWTFSSLHAFRLPVDIWAVVFVNAMLQLVSIIPIQILGGLGVSEAVSLFFLELFDFGQSQLATVLIGIRLLFYLTNLVMLLYLPMLALFSGKRAGSSG